MALTNKARVLRLERLKKTGFENKLLEKQEKAKIKVMLSNMSETELVNYIYNLRNN